MTTQHTQPRAIRLVVEHENDDWIAGTKQWRDEASDELRRLHEVNQELLNTLKESREVLQFENETPVGAIRDTIWMMQRPETLFDFMDAAITKAEGGAA